MTIQHPQGFHEGRPARPAPDDRAGPLSWLAFVAAAAFCLWFAAPGISGLLDGLDMHPACEAAGLSTTAECGEMLRGGK